MIKRIRRFFLVVMVCFSCTKEKVVSIPQNLKEYLNSNLSLEIDEVIACAASNPSNTAISYIFYYPIVGATDIQYFETSNVSVDKNDLSLYQPKILPKEDVFSGYLERFVRNVKKEAWCIVTYRTKGKLHKSNPIRLKHQTKPTEWSTKVTIDFSQKTAPKFLWNDGKIKENAIYFQVVTDKTNKLLSGTYTYDTWFQYYKLTNVVLNITREKPPGLLPKNNYNFTMMGVSLDNWVNLVIQKQFTAQ